MHICHEFVEMRPPLSHHRAGLEKQVHQHGLAATDIAENVESAGRLVAATASEQPADRVRAARGAVCCYPFFQGEQPCEQLLLNTVALDLVRRDESFIELG